MLVEIFYENDNFCKFFEKEANIKLIGSEKKVGRTRQLTTSEILTIIVYFHASGFKNFKTYYETMKRIYGKMLGDKGYIGAFEQLYEKGIHLIHRIRSNMKNKLVNIYDKLLLRKRGVVESVIDILKDKYSLQSTKLRSMTAFVAHVFSAVIAYSFRPNKPSIFRTKMLISID